MEFREFYSGVCAKIVFDYPTGTYFGELVDVPSPVAIQAESYDEIRNYLKQAVQDLLANRLDNLEDEWERVVRLEQIRTQKEAEEKAAKTAEEQRKADEAEELSRRRRFLR